MSDRNYDLNEVPGAAYNSAVTGARDAHAAGVRNYLAGVDPVRALAGNALMGTKDAAKIAGGGLLHLMTPQMQAILASSNPRLKSALESSSAFGDALARKYGGYENLKRTIAEHPYQFLADASMLVPAAGPAGRAMNAMAKAPAATNSVNALAKMSNGVPLTVHTPFHSRLADGPPKMVDQPVFAGKRSGPDPLTQAPPNYRTGKGAEFLSQRNNPVPPQFDRIGSHVDLMIQRYVDARRSGDTVNAERISRNIENMWQNDRTNNRDLQKAFEYIGRLEHPGEGYVAAYIKGREGSGVPFGTHYPIHRVRDIALKPKGRQPSPLAPTLAPRNALANPYDLEPELGGTRRKQL